MTPPVEVVGGEQHLTDPQAVAGERRRVALDEQQLADARGGLLSRKVARSGPQPEWLDARRDGTRGHEDDLSAGDSLGGQRIDEPVEPLRIEPAGRRERRG